MYPWGRSTLCAALFSCVLHIGALGVAATLMVSSSDTLSLPVIITLLQRAVLLPVQENAGMSNDLFSLPPKVEAMPAPRPQPLAPSKPVVKDALPKIIRPTSPAPVVKKKPLSPAPLTSPIPQEKIPELAMTVPPAEPPVSDTGVLSESSSVNRGFVGTESAGQGENTAAIGKGSRSNSSGRGGTSAQPNYDINPTPPYPLIARRIGAQGTVLLRVHVREDGSVASVELIHSSGFALLDESATRTVRENWRFVPARLDGTPVESWVEVPIKFVLEDS